MDIEKIEKLLLQVSDKKIYGYRPGLATEKRRYYIGLAEKDMEKRIAGFNDYTKSYPPVAYPVGVDPVLNTIETIKLLVCDRLGISQEDFDEIYAIVADINWQKFEVSKEQRRKDNEAAIARARLAGRVVPPVPAKS
jgi:hypothetical protein